MNSKDFLAGVCLETSGRDSVQCKQAKTHENTRKQNRGGAAHAAACDAAYVEHDSYALFAALMAHMASSFAPPPARKRVG